MRTRLIPAIFAAILSFGHCFGVGGPEPMNEKVLGFPVARSYSFEEIGNASPGVTLGSDPLGRLFVIQEGACIVFDDKNWTDLMENSESGVIVRVLEVAPNGDMYFGASGKWGKASFAENGSLGVHSIREEEIPAWASNASFESIVFTSGAVAFGGDSGIVYWDTATDKQSFCGAKDVMSVFGVGEDIFISSAFYGIAKLDTDSMSFVRVLDPYRDSMVIERTTQWGESEVAGVRSDGRIVSFDGQSVREWRTDIDDILELGVSAIQGLDGDRLAVAVKGKGLYLLDSAGRLVLASELSQFEGITDLMRSESGVLWISSGEGVGKLLYNSPVTTLDHRQGLNLDWPRIVNQGGKTYVVSDGKVYEEQPTGAGYPTEFEALDLSAMKDGVASCAASCDTGLLIGNSYEVRFRSQDGKLESVIENMNTSRLMMANEERSVCIAIGPSEICVLEKIEGRWRQRGERHEGVGFPSSAHSAVPGSIWLELGTNRVARLAFEDGDFSIDLMEDFIWDTRPWVNIGSVGTDVILTDGNHQRMYFDETRGEFHPNPKLDELFRSLSVNVLRPVEDDEGVVWMPHAKGVFCLYSTEQGYREGRVSLDFVNFNYPLVEIGDGSDVWIRSTRLLMHVDRAALRRGSSRPKPILTRIVDSRKNVEIYNAIESSVIESIPYTSNSLNFHFFPGTFSQLRNPSYQYMLEGYSEDWSLPVRDTMIGVTRLGEGDYRMSVRLLDATGAIGEMTTFDFSVEAPIYRTWYAYACYLALFACVVSAASKWLLHRAKRKNARLEELVRMRTMELDATNANLQTSVIEAQAAGKTKSQFLANMSHEIRTPMNGVMGMCTLLQDTPLTEEQKNYVDTIRSSSEILLAIINDILDFSKIEAGKLELESITFDLVDLVEDVLDLLSANSCDKDLSLVYHIDRAVSTIRVGDPTRIRQVLVNLVGNAIKFTSKGGVFVRIQNHGNGDFLRIEVKDTGIGVDPDKLEALFTPFSQEDESVTRRFGGTGLGLSISKMLTEMMGGEIWAESKVGVGSSFYFSVRAQVDTGSCVVETELNVVSDRTLLIVDDNEDSRYALLEIVKSWGMIPLEAESVDRAMETLKKDFSIDCALVCSSANADSALAVASRLRDEMTEEELPIVVLTSVKERIDERSIRSLGISKALSLPVRRSQLKRAFVRIFGNSDQVRSAARKKSKFDTIAESGAFRVLVVEDNPVNQKVASLLLNRLGFQVDLAGNGIEAVDSVSRQRYHIILMDVQMPEMDGLEATRAIRSLAIPEGQPAVFAMSAGVSDLKRQECLDAGMDGFIGKPVNIDNLKEALEKAIRIASANSRS